MALQDLTPQLRTRLSRVERAVGFFVTIATFLLVAGFAYYVYHTAERKGWFKTKIEYSTSLNNAAGLKVGDPVKLMGFSVGEITRVEAEDPKAYYGVTVYFHVIEPYYGYIWLDSKVRVAPADFLGNRNLEILKGFDGQPTVLLDGNKANAVLNSKIVDAKFKQLTKAILKENEGFTEHAARIDATNELNALIGKAQREYYTGTAKAPPYWIEPLESPALTERLESVVNGFEAALPNILNLTNQLTAVLTNVNEASSRLNALLTEAHPAVTNLAVITGNLKEPHGSLGEWLLPTNLSEQLKLTLNSAQSALKTADATLQTADTTLNDVDTNLTSLVSNLNLSLENLANLTSNLNTQVQSNSNIVSEVSAAIVHTDDLVQGLKRHWLLRSAFKTNKTEKLPKGASRLSSPKEKR